MKRLCSIEYMWGTQWSYCCYECFTAITMTSRWEDHRLVGLITVG